MGIGGFGVWRGGGGLTCELWVDFVKNSLGWGYVVDLMGLQGLVDGALMVWAAHACPSHPIRTKNVRWGPRRARACMGYQNLRG
jgi:hypothetical protein